MKKSILLITFTILSIAALPAFSLTGRGIMKKNKRLTEASTCTQSNVLLIMKGNFKEKKEYSAVSKKYGSRTRTRINFTFPSRIGFLVWDMPGRDSRQWLKLTSGRVRKISSSDKDNPWMNSHFYNQDIGSRDIDDFTYSLLGEKMYEGKKYFQIKSVKIKGTRVYDKSIILVDKQNFLIHRIKFFEKGRHTKTLTLEKYQKIQGIWTPRKAVMSRSDGRGRSIMYTKTIRYRSPVADSSLKLEGF